MPRARFACDLVGTPVRRNQTTCPLARAPGRTGTDMNWIDAAMIGLAAAAPTIILFAGFDAFLQDRKNTERDQ